MDIWDLALSKLMILLAALRNVLPLQDALRSISVCNILRIESQALANLYHLDFERDPTLDPGPNCPNPPSTTNIKCVFWGGPVSTTNANNFGQWRDNFEVVIAGSNGYTISSAPAIDGYGPPSSLGTNAINAPLDCNGYNTYMGFKIFNSGTPFDPNLCAAACSAQTAYDVAHPSPGESPQICEFFNTYILYDNGVSQGQYCVLYNETWSNNYATNSGYSSGSNQYTIDSSYTYSVTNTTTTCVKTSPTPNCSGPTGNGGNGIISGQVLNSASACSTACKTTTGCNMFSWGFYQAANVNICFLFSTTVATSDYIPSATSPFAYYDASCTNFATSTSCSSGAVYTAYPNPLTNPYGIADSDYAPFSASSYNPPSVSPLYTGAVKDINFAVPASGIGPVYGSSSFNSTYTTFVYHAFLIPPQDGSYTFTFQNVDDIAYLWQGSKAYSMWSESNHDVKAVFRNTPGTNTMSLVAGTCYPVTILFANAQGASVLDFTVTLPNGTAVTDTTGLLVQPSCSTCSSLGTFV